MNPEAPPVFSVVVGLFIRFRRVSVTPGPARRLLLGLSILVFASISSLSLLLVRLWPLDKAIIAGWTVVVVMNLLTLGVLAWRSIVRQDRTAH
jgi:hypothetical protein